MFSAEVGLIISAIAGLLLALVIFGIFARNKWGINTGTVVCPGCKTAQPAFRKPASLKQALWGGYTCPTCHRELDKWGREVSV
jgi:hypothetical protein